MARILLLVLVTASTVFAQDLEQMLDTKQRVKMALWNDGIVKQKPIKIKSITDFMLPEEILVPLEELED